MPRQSFSEQVQEAAESMSEQGMTQEYPEFILAPGPGADLHELERFRERYREQAARWREDPHHIPILHVPVRAVSHEEFEKYVEDRFGIPCLPEEPQDPLQPRRKIEV